MARPGRNVLIKGRWYGPSYPAAGDPPTVRSPKSAPAPVSPSQEPAPPVEETVTPEPVAGADTPQPPPRYGKGSGNAAWRDWARAVGIDLAALGGADAGREQILDAAHAAGILTDN